MLLKCRTLHSVSIFSLLFQFNIYCGAAARFLLNSSIFICYLFIIEIKDGVTSRPFELTTGYRHPMCSVKNL
jgi:hypothetical protein